MPNRELANQILSVLPERVWRTYRWPGTGELAGVALSLRRGLSGIIGCLNCQGHFSRYIHILRQPGTLPADFQRRSPD
jgi:hypothetical protein